MISTFSLGCLCVVLTGIAAHSYRNMCVYRTECKQLSDVCKRQEEDIRLLTEKNVKAEDAYFDCKTRYDALDHDSSKVYRKFDTLEWRFKCLQESYTDLRDKWLDRVITFGTQNIYIWDGQSPVPDIDYPIAMDCKLFKHYHEIAQSVRNIEYNRGKLDGNR